MRSTPLVWLALALGGLAGCSAPGPTEVADPAGLAVAGTADDVLELTACDGLALSLQGPSSLYVGSTPEGWEGTAPNNLVQLEAYRCERLSWGRFERGPVHVVQEWHSDFEAPATCRAAGVYDVRSILQSIWFDDPDLAAYARDVHGMPAFAADFASQSGVASWSMAWSLPGQPSSQVTFHELPGEVNRTTGPFVRRLFWADSDGVGLMDLREQYANDQVFDSNIATGSLRAPLLHGRAMLAPDFVAPANRQGHAHAAGSIAHYADTACLERLS